MKFNLRINLQNFRKYFFNKVFTCYAYQPNWSDLGETNGYPRFGRLDPTKAGYINVPLISKAPFYDIRLYNGATGLAAAFAIAISFLAF